MVNKKDEGNSGVNTNKKIFKIGYIMPISDIEGYKNNHWKEVRNILDDTINNLEDNYKEYDIEKFIVSEISGVNSIILKSIVSNIYKCDLVICDVSSRNPNVMFELGMRLAFDKKIIIIKDNATDYSFDTSVINHIEYEKNLNYISIKEFQEELRTYIDKAFKEKDGRAGYLDSFADVKVQTIESHSIKEGEAISEILYKLNNFNINLSNIEKQVSSLRNLNEKKNYVRKHSEIPNIVLNKQEVYAFADNILENVFNNYSERDKELPNHIPSRIIAKELEKEDISLVNGTNISRIQDRLSMRLESLKLGEQ